MKAGTGGAGDYPPSEEPETLPLNSLRSHLVFKEDPEPARDDKHAIQDGRIDDDDFLSPSDRTGSFSRTKSCYSSSTCNSPSSTCESLSDHLSATGTSYKHGILPITSTLRNEQDGESVPGDEERSSWRSDPPSSRFHPASLLKLIRPLHGLKHRDIRPQRKLRKSARNTDKYRVSLQRKRELIMDYRMARAMEISCHRP